MLGLWQSERCKRLTANAARRSARAIQLMHAAQAAERATQDLPLCVERDELKYKAWALMERSEAWRALSYRNTELAIECLSAARHLGRATFYKTVDA